MPAWLLSALTEGSRYALLAIALILVRRQSRVVGFAHVDIGICATLVASSLAGDAWVPMILVAMFVGGLVAASFALIILRPMRDAPATLRTASTLALSLFLTAATIQIWGPGRPITGPEGPTVFGLTASGWIGITGVFVVLGAAIWWSRSALGVGARATAADQVAAALIGLPVDAMRIAAWFASGALAAAGVVLAAPSFATASGAVGPALLMPALAAALLAGFRSIGAGAVAGFVVAAIDGLVRERLAMATFPGLSTLAVVGVVMSAWLLSHRSRGEHT